MIISLSRIEKLCADQDMTLYTLAKKSHVSYQTIHKYAKGKKTLDSMPLSTALRVAKALGVSIEDLYQPALADLKEGWNEVEPDFSVFVEDGKIISGLKSGVKIYPYTKDSTGSFTIASGSSVNDFDKLTWH